MIKMKKMHVLLIFLLSSKIIFADFYPHEYDEEILITEVGLYKLDVELNLIPIYTAQEGFNIDTQFRGMAYRFEDIVFYYFIRDRRVMYLLYSSVTNDVIETYFVDISSIEYITETTLSIYGRGFVDGRLTEITQIITIQNGEKRENNIGILISEYDTLDFVSGLFHNNNGVWSKRILYRFFDKNILININNVIQESIIPAIWVRFDSYNNVYYICINN